MHVAVKFIVVLFALALLFLGFIFLIAGGADNAVVGAVMLLAAFGLLGFMYYDSKITASQPKVVHQQFDVTMGGSGELQERKLNCPSCGAPVEGKDVTLMSGGLVIKCPYCGTTSAMEEEPKW